MTSPKPRPGILDINPYVAGTSRLTGIDRVIKLSSNEGALGPSPRALAAYQAMAGEMHRYPDGHAVALREALAARDGLKAEQIVCGAGSDELLQLLVRGYAGFGDEVLYSRHGFLVYPIAAKASGATPVFAEEIDLTASVDNLLAAVTERTRILFIANPNNPTGTYLSVSEMRRLRDGLPGHVLLVIDAAYAEFADRNDYSPGADLVETSENVVMTRTFSKIYGMGGLRLGWAYCPPAVADVLNRVRGPFNVSSAALEAGLAAVEDGEFLDLAQRHNSYWRAWFEEKVRSLGLETIPSVTNFILVRFPGEAGRDAAAADVFLRGKGIIVRAMGTYGLSDCLRITIGRDDEMQAAVAALAEFRGA
ncbi:histidinol-phosphate transaminase [Telmatospirillum siberiense]|uniref:Histidinol-phosphate aminotransferase n=1 Tax=Telmatospirillum siberiense TaxID=382514 RepID=A0A2N3Q0H4_9PROT|nr:histidinol-phosphate transaminase [Telmatospirillum siberiense]PKU26160.1 histidinol-phosphate transaminase [Telmatospirillum siberiense]